ncbi:unannotated protein [freshwater metagenome]|uniref:Unannotated protein n=1 Tax=freshwater metagenome TaxID=449393 RepID=A0A6J6FIW6_9ZZZZ
MEKFGSAGGRERDRVELEQNPLVIPVRSSTHGRQHDTRAPSLLV